MLLIYNSNGNKNKYAIHFNYIGGDPGGAFGTDIQILKDGAENGGVGFKIELIEKGGFSSNNIETQYTNMIFNEVKAKLENADLGVSNDIRDLLVNAVLDSKKKENDENSILWDMVYNQITENYLTKRSLKGNPKYGFKEFDIKNKVIPKGDENYSISIDTNQKNNVYNKMLNYIKENSQMVIYYKEFPIFEFNKNLLNGNNVIKEKMSDFLWTNLLNLNIKNNDYSQITNISNLNNLNKNSYTKNNEYIVSINKKNMINIPSNKLNMNGTLNKNNEDDEKMYYDLWYAFNAYNKNLENYLRRNNNSIESIKEELIDINNVLFLRNGTGNINDEHSSQTLYYANHLGLKMILMNKLVL